MSIKEILEKTIYGFEHSGLGYGDHINHSDIDSWSGFETPDMNGLNIKEQKEVFTKSSLLRLAIVDGFRDYLLKERLMYIQSVPGSGYVIVEPSEQTNAAVEKGMKQIIKGLKHATSGVENVNKARLSNSQREYNATVLSRLRATGMMLGKKRDYLQIE